MNCVKCEKPLKENNKYCPECGAKAKKPKNKEANAKSTKKWVRYLFGLLITFVVIIILIVSLVVYSHHSEYAFSYNRTHDQAYFTDNKFSDIASYNDGLIQVRIPSDVFNSMVNDQLGLIQLPENIWLKEVYVNTNTERLFINSNIFGINVPISSHIEFNIDGQNISMSFSNLQLGNKNIPILKPIENYLLENILKYDFSLNTDSINIPDLFQLSEITLEYNQVILNLKLENETLEKMMDTIRDSSNGAILNIYEKSKQPPSVSALKMLKSNTLSNKQQQLLVQDLVNDQVLLYHLLVASNHDALDTLFQSYERLFGSLSKTDILNLQEELIDQYISIDFRPLLTALEEELTKKEYYIFNNQPYNMLDNTYITIEYLINEYSIPLSTDLSNLLLFYNQKETSYNIAYRLPDNTYILISTTNYTVLDEEAFMELTNIEDNGTIQYVFEPNPSIEQPIKGFYNTDEIFIRYMKANNKYAFVIASPDFDYQNYTSFAIKNYGDTWKIVESDIADLNQFNRKHPDFDINTFTDLHLTPPEILSEDEITIVLQDLDYRGLESEDEVTVKYCSYRDDYISIKLSNNNEYIYKMDYGYLDSVYTRENIPSWWKVPELILLQY